jgi:phospholipid/cholesterol/gamma-HCH transport system ATP-binding protein
VDEVIEVHGLVNRLGATVVHDGLDLTVRRGEVLGVIGASGSGKTTLLRTLIMLHRPAAGHVRLFGRDVRDLSEAETERLRERMGVMFQRGALFGSLTVRENVEVPLLEHTRLDPAAVAGLARLKLDLVGLPPAVENQMPRELSGGMVKRAAVARALALDPPLLFLDEPSAGLDPVSANAMDELILRLRSALGLTVVIVTHDLDSLWRTTDRVAFLGEKRVLCVAAMAALSKHDHPVIRQYFTGPRGRAAQETAWAVR